MPRTRNSTTRSVHPTPGKRWMPAVWLAAAALAAVAVVTPAAVAGAHPVHVETTTRVVSSMHVAAAHPLHAATPKITGKAVVGSKLAAHPGTWTSGTHFSYRWLAAGRPIAGATTSTLVLHAAQQGKRVRVRVTGSHGGFTRTVKTSASTAPVRAAAPKPVSKPAPVIPPNPGNSVNCPDFATHDQAQAWFDKYYPYYGDVARLDADHDGIACEDLP